MSALAGRRGSRPRTRPCSACPRDASARAAAAGAAGHAPRARTRCRSIFTGQWVAVITEDWRWRMVTPPVGDSASIRSTRRPGRDRGVGLEKDRAENGFCKAFGPPGLIRQPTRLRIDWQGRRHAAACSSTPAIRLGSLHFTPQPAGERSLQGDSTANWFRQTQSRGVFAANTPRTGGSLQVSYDEPDAGYSAPNGVPYGEKPRSRSTSTRLRRRKPERGSSSRPSSAIRNTSPPT